MLCTSDPAVYDSSNFAVYMNSKNHCKSIVGKLLAYIEEKLILSIYYSFSANLDFCLNLFPNL